MPKKTDKRIDTGRVQQKDRTRKALIQAANEILNAGNYPSVNDAAKRAMISQATAYRYFSTHQELCQEAFSLQWPGFEDLIQTIHAMPAIEKRVKAAVKAFVEQIFSNEISVRLWISLSYDPQFKADPTRVRPNFRDELITSILGTGVSNRAKRHDMELELSAVISAESVMSLKETKDVDCNEATKVISNLAARVVAPLA